MYTLPDESRSTYCSPSFTTVPVNVVDLAVSGFCAWSGEVWAGLAQQRHLVPFYHDEGIESGEVPLQSIKLCKKLLRYMLQNIPNGFLVIDGLDECDVSERKSLLDFLNEIVSLCDSTNPGKIRILILSRDEPDIKRYLSTGMVVRIDSRDTLQDIELYVRHRASLVQSKFDLTAEDREYIEQNVLDRTQGNGNPPSPEATLIW